MVVLGGCIRKIYLAIRRYIDVIGKNKCVGIITRRQYLEFVADQRAMIVGLKPIFGSSNPFSFMELQDVQELTNFFERRVAAYQVAVDGEVGFNEAF